MNQKRDRHNIEHKERTHFLRAYFDAINDLRMSKNFIEMFTKTKKNFYDQDRIDPIYRNQYIVYVPKIGTKMREDINKYFGTSVSDEKIAELVLSLATSVEYLSYCTPDEMLSIFELSMIAATKRTMFDK
jgi:hypothetical protein